MKPRKREAVEHRRRLVNAWGAISKAKRPVVAPDQPLPIPAPPNMKPPLTLLPSEELRRYFAGLKAVPLTDEPRPDILGTLRELLIDAGGHPASRLIAREIVASLIKIRVEWLEGKNAVAHKPSPLKAGINRDGARFTSEDDAKSRKMFAARFEVELEKEKARVAAVAAAKPLVME
jgi:hypothetical protein